MSSSLPTERGSSDDRAQFRAFLSDEETRAVVDQVVKDLVIPHAAVHKGGIRSCIDFLAEHRSPRILLVDLTLSELPLSDINELAEVCEPGVTVVAIGDRNDVGLFRELMNQGISDYLVKPITPALLQKSLLGTVDGVSRTRQTNRLGRLVAVTGARGGVGASMLATNVAYHIAEVRRRRVALVDLDLQFGTVALSLDLEPSNGFREALETPGRIDGLYIDRTMTRYSDTLYVLSAEESVDETFTIDESSVDLLIQELRTKFHYVVVDLPRADAALRSKIVSDASNVLLVSDLSLSGMRRRVAIAAVRSVDQCLLQHHIDRQQDRRAQIGRDPALRVRKRRRPQGRYRHAVRRQERRGGDQCRQPRGGGTVFRHAGDRSDIRNFVRRRQQAEEGFPR